MAIKRLNPSVKRSRTRSGCLTCRDRHMKCDEQQPVCRNCIKSKRKCYRGIRLNFTQYTIYNPEESSESIPIPLNQFRILDQSITIASLYANGRQSYEPYLHLHDPQDLQESDFHYQEGRYPDFVPRSQTVSNQDILSMLEMPQAQNIPLNPIVPSNTMIQNNNTVIADTVPFDRNNIILENFDITNLLLNDSYFIHQNFQNSPSGTETAPNFVSNNETNVMPTTSVSQSELLSSSYNVPFVSPTRSKSSIDESKFYVWEDIQLPASVDFDLFKLLIDKEKYFWFLDLFNNLDIWKSTIPSYCLSELSTNQNSLLIDCLMACSEKSQTNLVELFDKQLFFWINCRSFPINSPRNLKPFEDLLISTTLILLGVQRKPNKYNSGEVQSILTYQTRIYNKILFKLKDYLNSKKPKSVILISTIQSMILLKYFLLKLYNIDNDISLLDCTENNITFPKSEPIQEDTGTLNLNIEYHTSNIKSTENNSFHAFSFGPEDLNEDILYSNPVKINLFQLNEFEIDQLNNSFKDFDFQQFNRHYKPKERVRSDASKVREQAWYLIKVNYRLYHSKNESSNNKSQCTLTIPEKPPGPEIEVTLSDFDPNQEIKSPSGSPGVATNNETEDGLLGMRNAGTEVNSMSRTSSGSSISRFNGRCGTVVGPTMSALKVVLPNQRGIALNLLLVYATKLDNLTNGNVADTCTLRIESIFKLISESTMDPTVKRHWRRDFGWLLA